MAAGPDSAGGEFRRHWRALLATCLGLSTGLSLNTYLLSIFAPYLIKAFGWSRSQWAMLGVIQFLVMVTLPIAGRLADRFGVRRVATFGCIAFPCFMVASTFLDGDIRHFFWLQVALVLCSSTTTTVVYARVIATTFRRRRGMAFGIMGTATPLMGALASPLLTALIDRTDWQTGYWAMAATSLLSGLGMMSLLPRDATLAERTRPAPRTEDRNHRPLAVSAAAPGSYRRMLAMPALWIIVGATVLVNLPFALASMQLKMVALDQGLPSAQAALMVSAFAIGSIAGRLVGGVACDHFPATRVATVSFALPVAGLLVLAAHPHSVIAVGAAIVLMGMAFGGEGDVVPYLCTRYFPRAMFSSASGLQSAGVGAAMASGNVFLGLILARGGSYADYMLIAAASCGIGALLFLLLERQPVAEAEEEPAPVVPTTEPAYSLS
ncbi:MAG: MFS transporter [Sphingomonadales bacterium]|nr:MFS transporter [Sphingomonadales bacterium]